MKVLITGSRGFIAKNLIVTLQQIETIEITTFNREDDIGKLDSYTKECDFVFHLAGVNRPQVMDEYMQGNFKLSQALLNSLEKNANSCPIVFASSSQALEDNPYGKSKKSAEEILLNYSKEKGSKVLVYRFPNVFGKWCRPNYNSAVATFCFNIAHELPINVNDPNVIMNLVYIDDLVEELINALNENENSINGFCEVPIVYSKTLGEIVDLIYSFKESREECSIPDMSNSFVKKLYSTYLSYLPEDKFSYYLKMNIDNRGSFSEFIKNSDRGQVSVNISEPGIIKGNHWHHTKNEKFLVVSGTGVIRLRQIGEEKVIEYHVSEHKLEVVDIPVGYTHSIENIGDKRLVTIMWVNEIFNTSKPDTYLQKV